MSAAGEARAALVENLKALHLPAMRHCYEEAARRAEKETKRTCWRSGIRGAARVPCCARWRRSCW
jgi:hypothetical protein